MDLTLGSIPPRAKTWNIQGNFVQLSGASGTQHAQQAFVNAKNQVLGFGSSNVITSGSSDSATAGMDGADRIGTDRTKVVAAAGAHSWWVFKMVVTGQQVCFDFNSATGAYIATVVHSPGGLFTGGSTTARPTAADEIVNRSSVDWLIGNNTNPLNITAWCSSDGTNIVVAFSTTTRLVAGWIIGKIYDPRPWITLPFYCCVFSNGAVDTTFTSPAAWVLPTSANSFTCKSPSNSAVRLRATAQVNLTGPIYLNTPTQNTITHAWEMEQPGLFNATAPDYGHFGVLPDMFFSVGPTHATVVVDALDSSKVIILLGCLALPWQSGNWALP